MAMQQSESYSDSIGTYSTDILRAYKFYVVLSVWIHL